ncbi:hypothetical protein BJY24_007643 [Nocardia transvalensis]|uniref:Secreted protein n=1 Tax=Nocardia transvalensis TaxID=37333 RepID=A0A7W9PM65_9NOCA|nr:hypothetical protein [Nocardia transvalensis]MBB5918731.1 hypothetical protein [Nocardia transvalensis]
MIKYRALGLLAATIACAGFGAMPTAAADPGVACVWDGGIHHKGSTVVAGGRSYTCGADLFGGPRWYPGEGVGQRSTVSNPGTEGNPAHRFSPGARQYGTDYMDYCVGNQLIEGREAVYEVASDATGFVFWKAAEPASGWSFDNAAQPGPSWRSSGLCHDGSLT